MEAVRTAAHEVSDPTADRLPEEQLEVALHVHVQKEAERSRQVEATGLDGHEDHEGSQCGFQRDLDTARMAPRVC